ncbi:MAG TPA: lactate racemase domain-containing protein, partial [Isosphaeraceae bacterium]|nr:lactate racemase domain-containing protein [Isosphaeraceae bacterium]
LAGGVEREAITVVASGAPPEQWTTVVPAGVAWALHDPADRAQLAYLANTEQRRVYLNRALTDADCVVPVGLLGYHNVLGYCGPWSAIFPDLSDTDTLRSFRAQASDIVPDRDRMRPTLAESANVSWLLGSQFHLGVVAGVGGGLSRVVAGSASAVRAEGARAVDAAWAFRPDRRAELVVIGVGASGTPTHIGDLAEGLATATRLVQHGGKIVVLSRVCGPVGPAVRRLSQVDQPHPSAKELRGHEGEADYPAARQLAQALAWADVYLLSSLDEDDVDSLGMIPLGRPEEARKLVAVSSSCIFLSEAERTRAEVEED